MNAVQLKMARVALDLGVKEAAIVAGVSHDTITRLEAGASVKQSTAEKVQRALEELGVEFIAENGGGLGVRLRNPP
jgi:predicted transcriptional regulator